MWWTAALALGLAACKEKEPAPPGGGLHDPTGTTDDDVLVLLDEHNASLAVDLAMATTEVEAQEDFCVDWSGLTIDRLGRPVDPADVRLVGLLQYAEPPEGTTLALEGNALDQQHAGASTMLETRGGATSACVGEFEVIGNPFDPDLLEEDPDETWFVWVQDADTPLAGALVVPREASTAHEVVLDDESTRLTLTSVELAGRPAAEARAGGPVEADWSGITTDALGQPFDTFFEGRLVIAWFADATVEDVEANALTLESAATRSWSMTVFDRTTAHLPLATDANGTPFTGFTADGLWTVSLVCSSCWTSPPLVLAVVEPR